MSDMNVSADKVRELILSDPATVLDDRVVMRALINADQANLGENVVDIRGVALERLEARLQRLEDTHRNVIAAAYDNLAGTNQVHRAVLALIEPTDFMEFLACLPRDVASILKIEKIRLCLESTSAKDGPVDNFAKDFTPGITFVPPGSVAEYILQGRNVPLRPITLRQITTGGRAIYGADADWIQSEAIIKLDLGTGTLPGMLVLGSVDPIIFNSNQGTDLLGFFGDVFERIMRKWLA